MTDMSFTQLKFMEVPVEVGEVCQTISLPKMRHLVLMESGMDI